MLLPSRCRRHVYCPFHSHRSRRWTQRLGEIEHVAIASQLPVRHVGCAPVRSLLQHKRRLTTGLLNFVVRDAVAVFPPPLTKDGKRGKIYLAQQVRVNRHFLFSVSLRTVEALDEVGTTVQELEQGPMSRPW